MALNFMCRCFREVQTVAVVDNKVIGLETHLCKGICKLQIPAEVENHTEKRVFCLFLGIFVFPMCHLNRDNGTKSCFPAHLVSMIFAAWSFSGLSTEFWCAPGLFYFQYQIRSGESRSLIIHYSCKTVGFNIILVKWASLKITLYLFYFVVGYYFPF